MSMKATSAPIFSTLIFLLCFSSTVVSVSFSKIPLPLKATGPEAFAFLSRAGDFYTGVADGRVLKYVSQARRFEDFGSFAPNRSNLCNGRVNDPNCGRPLGLALHHATKRLYVCDAFYGLGVLEPEGGVGTILSSSADGQRYRLCDGLDVHQQTGDVYFTDASSNYDIRQILLAVAKNDSSGRLLRYDLNTKQVTVLLRNLSGPGGVAVDKDAQFVLVTEFITGRTKKMWLKGPKANTYDIINSQPMPDNIKRTESGNFWLAAVKRNLTTLSLSIPIGQWMNASGDVIKTVNFGPWYGLKPVSEVQEFLGKLYLGSMFAPFVGVYKD
ncbi:Six-bladed beta-propeller, TolB-like protein [Corchorus olitorius]|uniref:Six-bladed beta-propeller, TolB-like protein n=1 Tax=Corchorus olitorius TaxID=93759 RepID=A0A1R3KK05_9ROSI|nr:Six-bladed beta-propeller, TolB-like protein [Corchorus olitorius]